MNYSHADWLHCLWFLPLLCLILFLLEKRCRRRIHAYIQTPRLRDLTFSSSATRKSFLSSLFLLLSFAFLILALARPQWGYDWETRTQKGTDIMILLDVSSSMLAEDLSPNRLEVAKRKILDLLPRLRGDRIGLIGFAGTAFIQCPLTTDYDAFRMFLDFLTTDSIARQGTSFYSALNLARESLLSGGVLDAESSSVLMITDGEDHNEKLRDMLGQLRKDGMRVFILGVGGVSGAPIPLKTGGFKKSAEGEVILSRLNESLLSTIASDSGGVYARIEANDSDLDRVYNGGIKGELKDKNIEDQRVKVWHDRFVWFLILGILAFFSESLLRASRGSKKLKNKVLLSGIFFASLSGILPQVDPLAASPKSSKEIIESYNRGVENYRKGDFDEARKDFAQSAVSEDEKLASQSLFNLGNTEAQVENFEGAIAAYEEALKYSPQEKRILENLEVVKNLEKQKKEQQKQGQGDPNDKNKSEQNQSSKDGEAGKGGGSDSSDDKDSDQKDSNDSAKEQDKEGSSANDHSSSDQKRESQAGQEGLEDKQAKKPEDEGRGGERQEGEEEQASAKSLEEDSADPEHGQSQEDGGAPETEESEKTGVMQPRQAEHILRQVEDQAAKYMGRQGSAGVQDEGEDGRGGNEHDW